MSRTEFAGLVNMTVDLIKSGFQALQVIQALREYGLSYDEIEPIIKQAYTQKVG